MSESPITRPVLSITVTRRQRIGVDAALGPGQEAGDLAGGQLGLAPEVVGGHIQHISATAEVYENP